MPLVRLGGITLAGSVLTGGAGCDAVAACRFAARSHTACACFSERSARTGHRSLLALLPRLVERARERGARVVAIARRFRETAIDDGGERVRHVRRNRLQRRRSLRDVRDDHGRRALVVERKTAAERLEGDDAERVEVAASVDLVAGDLLGAHVVDGAEHLSRHRERRGLGDAGDAEVGDHRAPGVRVEENVLRLDVAVHDAALVRVGEGERDVANDRHRRSRDRARSRGAAAPRATRPRRSSSRNTRASRSRPRRRWRRCSDA